MANRVVRGLCSVLLVSATLSVQGAQAAESDSTTTAASPQEQSAEVRKLPGGALLRVYPGSRFTLARPILLQLGTTPAKTLTQTLRLQSGRVDVELPNPNAKVATTAVLIQAPHKVSAVAKGGRSVVIAQADGVTVAAVQGDMLAAAGNDWRMLPSTLVRQFGRGGSVQPDRSAIGSPHTTLSVPLALRVAGQSIAVTASATPTALAAGYQFAVWHQGAVEWRLLRRIDCKTQACELGDLPAGNYSVSARAVDAVGLESAESPLVPLRVVTAELPEGAKLSSRGILLRPQQRVRLLGNEGVEISYGKASHFVPAPNSIGIIRGEPTLVRLRSVGSTQELPLMLEPSSSVHARIQIGPTRARWPQDKVVVSIRLTDRAGRAIPPSVAVSPSVRVNLTPVELSWQRSGNLLTTEVPQPAEAGPWVVRVEVADDTGSVIQRDFLEVATQPIERGRAETALMRGRKIW